MLAKKNLLATVLFLSLTLSAQANDISKLPPKSDPNPGKSPTLDKCDRETRAPADAVVIRTVDGDTVHVRTSIGSFSVRMLGMDTQETHFMGKSQGFWAEKASSTLAGLLPPGTALALEYGSDSCDSHGRLLAHVHKKSSSSNGLIAQTHVNAEMVKLGLAVNYCVAPDFRYCNEFSRFTQNAIDRKTGMFSDPNLELPYDFRRRLQNAPQRSYVGDIETKEVRTPGHQDETPVANRVFFYSRDAVQSPYRIVGE